ncbi:MAG: hypothetical protein SA339_13140 [Methanomassiliicoccus sp.]|nr:hypothetical protein [Methanomassiliicoccus sp.]
MTVEEGTWDESRQIRDLWNSGMEPEEIGEKIGRDRRYVCVRLVSLEAWGEVKRGPRQRWTHSEKRARGGGRELRLVNLQFKLTVNKDLLAISNVDYIFENQSTLQSTKLGRLLA